MKNMPRPLRGVPGAALAAIRCNARLAHAVPPCLIDCMLGPCGPLFSICSVLVGARLTSCRPPDAATRPPRAIDSPCEVPPSRAPCPCRTKQPKLVRARMGTAAERDGVRRGEGRKAMHGGRRQIENKNESKKKSSTNQQRVKQITTASRSPPRLYPLPSFPPNPAPKRSTSAAQNRRRQNRPSTRDRQPAKTAKKRPSAAARKP